MFRYIIEAQSFTAFRRVELELVRTKIPYQRKKVGMETWWFFVNDKPKFRVLESLAFYKIEQIT